MCWRERPRLSVLRVSNSGAHDGGMSWRRAWAGPNRVETKSNRAESRPHKVYQQTPPWTLLVMVRLLWLFVFCVFHVGGSSKSSRVVRRKCINKLPISFRKCVNKLPLRMNSPLSYARESFDLQFFRCLWCWWVVSGNSIIIIFWVPSRCVFIPKLVIEHVLLAFSICTCKKSKRTMRTTAWNIVSINKRHMCDHFTINYRPTTVWKFRKWSILIL